MDTNQIMRDAAPLSLEKLTALMSAAQSPIGFVVSTAAYKELKERTGSAGPSWLFGGIALVEDPSLAATEIDVAFTEEAWRKRLAEIKSPI